MLTPSAATAEISPMFSSASALFQDPENIAFETLPSSSSSAATARNSSGARRGLGLASACRLLDMVPPFPQ